MKLRNAHTYTLVVCICVSVCVCEVENCLGKESQRAGRGFPCGGRVHFLARELPYVVGSAQKEKKKKKNASGRWFSFIPHFLHLGILSELEQAQGITGKILQWLPSSSCSAFNLLSPFQIVQRF